MNHTAKKILAGTIVTSLISVPLLQEDASARTYYYWHHGDMDDSTVLNTNFSKAIQSNHFTYDDVNINTNYKTFKNVMTGNYPYKKTSTGIYKSRNASFIFSTKNGKISNTSKLKGMYFSFNDYDISTSKIKSKYGSPDSVKTMNGGKTYVYNAKYGIKNKFDFVKTKNGYKLSGFMTTK